MPIWMHSSANHRTREHEVDIHHFEAVNWKQIPHILIRVNNTHRLITATTSIPFFRFFIRINKTLHSSVYLKYLRLPAVFSF